MMTPKMVTINFDPKIIFHLLKSAFPLFASLKIVLHKLLPLEIPPFQNKRQVAVKTKSATTAQTASATLMSLETWEMFELKLYQADVYLNLLL